MDKKIINKCCDLVNLLADKDSLTITLSLAHSDKNAEQLIKDTQLNSEVLKGKLEGLVRSNIVRYRSSKNNFTVSDSHVLAIVKQIEEKANVELFHEREV